MVELLELELNQSASAITIPRWLQFFIALAEFFITMQHFPFGIFAIVTFCFQKVKHFFISTIQLVI